MKRILKHSIDVDGYTRRLPNGQVVTVKPYDRVGDKGVDPSLKRPQQQSSKPTVTINKQKLVASAKNKVTSNSFTSQKQTPAPTIQMPSNSEAPNVNKDPEGAAEYNSLCAEATALLEQSKALAKPLPDQFVTTDAETGIYAFNKTAFNEAMNAFVEYQTRIQEMYAEKINEINAYKAKMGSSQQNKQ